MLKSGILRFALSVVIFAIAPLVQADALDDILERGTIRVGVAEFVPWTMRTQSGELVGFEIDVARKIAADMNVTPEFKVYEWEKMVPALNQGEIDVIAAGMAITPQAALQVNFTMPLGQSGISLATNMEKTRNIDSLDDLNDDRVIITVVSDTMAQSVARAFFDEASIRAYPSSDQAEDDVLNSRAHAYLASVPEINFLALRNAKKIDVPIREPLVASSEGLAVRKGEQELLNFLNAWVVARQTDKWLATTREYWFNTIEWLPGMRD
ncbi:MAG: transporter substrate-binding domain-containing protein [Woeseiaceae bacterium]|nr:transporter substrate-binding domain-containing protein [Woeseiaceae bacterium]